MKIWLVTVLVMGMLCGCSTQETWETVADEWIQPVMVEKQQLLVNLPPEAALEVVESDAGTVYSCQDYDIYLETWASGDMNSTIRKLTGFDRADLTVMETATPDWTRYDFVWVSASEAGDRMGRAVILDDGNFHYCLSALGDADKADLFRDVWQELFGSVALG